MNALAQAYIEGQYAALAKFAAAPVSKPVAAPTPTPAQPSKPRVANTAASNPASENAPKIDNTPVQRTVKPPAPAQIKIPGPSKPGPVRAPKAPAPSNDLTRAAAGIQQAGAMGPQVAAPSIGRIVTASSMPADIARDNGRTSSPATNEESWETPLTEYFRQFVSTIRPVGSDEEHPFSAVSNRDSHEEF